jgi:hypothetical protein
VSLRRAQPFTPAAGAQGRARPGACHPSCRGRDHPRPPRGRLVPIGAASQSPSQFRSVPPAPSVTPCGPRAGPRPPGNLPKTTGEPSRTADWRPEKRKVGGSTPPLATTAHPPHAFRTAVERSRSVSSRRGQVVEMPTGDAHVRAAQQQRRSERPDLHPLPQGTHVHQDGWPVRAVRAPGLTAGSRPVICARNASLRAS